MDDIVEYEGDAGQEVRSFFRSDLLSKVSKVKSGPNKFEQYKAYVSYSTVQFC
jgi:hypothetical protein